MTTATRLAAAAVFALVCAVTLAGTPQAPGPTPPILQDPQTIPLWSNGAPGALGDEASDKPSLTIYMPPNTSGRMTAVIVAPGGSYAHLSMNLEGRAPANYFNSLGIAAFVLQYRLGPRYRHPIQLGDVQRAIRLVRFKASEWHLAADRLGIMGFSAGGHLASMASTHFDAGDASATDPVDRIGSRPDFAILAYPVISFTEPWTHQLSKKNLLGDDVDPALARSLSTDTQVTAQTPPTFLFHTTADTTVPVENSIHYFLALRAAGVPAELHVFKDGRHGSGLGLQDPALREWPALLANWLRASGF
jgi:acetyl esterase/lipase